MTSTAHALVAAAIASKFPDPLLSGSLALASHFIMDCIPHWDIGTNWRSRSKNITGGLAIAETVIGITIAYTIYAAKVPGPLLLFTIAIALLPDWLETPWYIFFARQNKHVPGEKAGFWEKFTYNVYKTENLFHSKAQYPFGVLTQVIAVAFFIVLLS